MHRKSFCFLIRLSLEHRQQYPSRITMMGWEHRRFFFNNKVSNSFRKSQNLLNTPGGNRSSADAKEIYFHRSLYILEQHSKYCVHGIFAISSKLKGKEKSFVFVLFGGISWIFRLLKVIVQEVSMRSPFQKKLYENCILAIYAPNRPPLLCDLSIYLPVFLSFKENAAHLQGKRLHKSKTLTIQRSSKRHVFF